VDIGLIVELGESLEMQMHKVPKLVEMHNTYNNNPHIVLIYENGTSLFAKDDQTPQDFFDYLKPPPSKENLAGPQYPYEPKYWQKQKKSHKESYYKYEIGEVIHFDSRTNTLTILIDRIQGHIKEIIITIYMVATVLNVLVFMGICGCIMCCNTRYRMYCDEVIMHCNNQRPSNQDFNPSETQIELMNYSEES